ncbi:MAG: 2-oxo acid dehydrogenase subunit E2 [Myxococcota bacterium]
MIAIGTWRTTKDPSVYGAVEVEMDETLRYVEAFRAATGKRLTVTHLMALAVGKVLEAMPDANALLRFNRIYLRKSVDVFFQVAMKDEESGQIDLSGLTIRQANTRSVAEIVDEFEAVATKVRAGKDEEKENTRRTFKRLPGWLVGPVLDLISFLTYTLNLNLSWAGIPRDPFGSVMVTNVGSLGLEEAYVPLVPYSKVPLLVAMGALKRVPVVREGDRIEVATVMRLFATFDHRVLDGAHASKMATTLKAVFADPWTHFGGVERPAALVARG